MEPGLDLAFTHVVALGDLRHGVHVPVPPHEQPPVLLGQRAKECVQRPGDLPPLGGGIPAGVGDAQLHLLAQGHHLGLPSGRIKPVQLAEGKVPAYFRKVGEEILRALGRDRPPRGEIGVVHAFLRVLVALDDALGDGLQLPSVGRLGLHNGLILPFPIQVDDLFVFH